MLLDREKFHFILLKEEYVGELSKTPGPVFSVSFWSVKKTWPYSLQSGVYYGGG